MKSQPTTLEKLTHSRPVLKAIADSEESPASDRPMRYYRVQFAVNHVKPKGLPPFPYVSSKLYFDCLVYTAIVVAAGLDEALKEIRKFWPDAQARTAQENKASFEADDSHLPSVTFGSTTIVKKRSVFRGWKFWRK